MPNMPKVPKVNKRQLCVKFIWFEKHPFKNLEGEFNNLRNE
jgi:hypothetical protein